MGTATGYLKMMGEARGCQSRQTFIRGNGSDPSAMVSIILTKNELRWRMKGVPWGTVHPVCRLCRFWCKCDERHLTGACKTFEANA